MKAKPQPIAKAEMKPKSVLKHSHARTSSSEKHPSIPKVDCKSSKVDTGIRDTVGTAASSSSCTKESDISTKSNDNTNVIKSTETSWTKLNGSATVKFLHYTKQFSVQDGILKFADLDNEFALDMVFPSAQITLKGSHSP
jgi:hypothetical protein